MDWPLILAAAAAAASWRRRPAPPAPASSRAAWIAQLVHEAEPIAARLGVPLSLAVAQAALESGWGRRAPGNNLYGIKGIGPAGTVQVSTREEFKPGEVSKIKAGFRAYHNLAESVADWAKLLATTPRYAPLTQMTPGGALLWLWASGYATATRYPAAVVAVSRSAAKLANDARLRLTLSDRQRQLAAKLAAIPAAQRRPLAKRLLETGQWPR